MCTAICTGSVALASADKLNDPRQRQFTIELDVLCMCAPIKTHRISTCNYMQFTDYFLKEVIWGNSCFSNNT